MSPWLTSSWVGPEYGPKSGPLRLRLGLVQLPNEWSGIWAEVRPVETSSCREIDEIGMSGIWAEVRPVETPRVPRHAYTTVRPEYGPKSGPLRQQSW